MSQSKVQNIEISLAQAEAKVELGAAIERLHGNKDFQKVILNGYFKDEAVRLVMAKSAPGMDSDDTQKELDRGILGIGQLRNYFVVKCQEAKMAEKSIEDNKQEREFLLAEELQGE